MTAPLPDPALVVLVGPAGAGKSFWAAAHRTAAEIVSSDALRAVVGTGPADLEATDAAFAVLEQIVRARLARRLTTVVDTLGFEPSRRRAWRRWAAEAGVPAVLVVFRTPAALCRRRNATRDRPVPAAALTAQLRSLRLLDVADEHWDLVHEVITADDAGPEPVVAPAAPEHAAPPGELPQVHLQLSRFPWGADPAGWLRAVAGTAEEVGFAGLALMDHLLQIPQVGRAWDPIPEPFVTLGLLAGATGRLQLGTLVSPVSYRAPGPLAKAVATLDVLSGGRAFCGLGAGWWDREHRAFGVDLPPPRDRVDRVEDALRQLRAWWGAGTKPLSAPRFTLPETTCYPRPVHDVPILVGARGPRMLRLAGALGDGCNVPADPDPLPGRIAAVRAAAERAGKDPAQVRITVLDTPVIGDDREDVARRVERARGRTAAAAFRARNPAGTAVEHRARYAALRAAGVDTVFLAPAELTGPDDVRRCAPLLTG
jgi:alkanesulfonate monooxygenase SsuD/methylene tetrahydromethanopterin reductase-like flavin-dependent oxidoreductase (luciferase family)/predicted kinase